MVALVLCITLIVLAFFSASYGFIPAETLRDTFNAGFGEEWQIIYAESRHDVMSQRLWIASGIMALSAIYTWRSRVWVNHIAARFIQDGLALWRAAVESAKDAFLGGGPWTLVQVLILMTVGGALRLWFLEAPMGGDEASAFYIAKQPILLAMTNQWAVLQPTAIWGVKLTTWLFGDAAWAVRLSMLIAGLVLIPVTFWAAVTWSNRTVGAFADAGVAVAWPLVAYSVIARGYANATLLFVFLLALTPYLARTANLAAAAVFAVAMALSVYSVQSMVFPCMGLVGFLGAMMVMDSSRPFPQRVRRSLFTCTIVGVGGAALTLILLSPFLVAHGFLALTVSQSSLGGDPRLPFFAFFASQATKALGTWVIDLPVLVQVLFGGGFLVGLVVASWTRVLAVALVLSILPIYFIIGEEVPPSRIWQFLLPAVLLVSAVGLARMLSVLVPRRAVAPAATVVICVITVWTSVNAFQSGSVISKQAGRENQPFYDTTVAVAAVVAPGDLVLGNLLVRPGFRYEVEQLLARRSLRLAAYPDAQDHTKLAFRVCRASTPCPKIPPSTAYVAIKLGYASIDHHLATAGLQSVPDSERAIVFETTKYLVQRISGLN